MKQKTQAIILNTAKYGENKLIINSYTREYGRMGFIVSAIAAKKASPLPYCQPLFQNEVEFNYNPTRDLQQAKSLSPAYAYLSIPYKTSKSSIAFFIAEVLRKTLVFTEKNIGLYDFISASLKMLDIPEIKGTNFHLKFLMTLSKYLGFYPANRYSQTTPYFDIEKSKFTDNGHNTHFIISPPYSQMFDKLLDNEFTPCENLKITGNDRSFLLNKIIDYYKYRFENINTINSLDVLQMVFH